MRISINKRPHSAFQRFTHYSSSTKSYRVPQCESLNLLKNNIYNTFCSNNNESYNNIKQLTQKSSRYSKKIDRLCSKFSIRPAIQSHFQPKTVDSQYIAKNFVKNKGKIKQKQQRIFAMHQQIQQQSKTIKVSARKSITEQFFKITCQNLKKLQKFDQKKKQKSSDQYIQQISQQRQKSRNSRYDNIERQNELSNGKKKDLSKGRKRQQHPYLKLYAQSQRQALQLILNNNMQHLMEVNQNGEYPHLPQPQEWQKHQKGLKDIYSGIKRLRYTHSARERTKSTRGSLNVDRIANSKDPQSFYIT